MTTASSAAPVAHQFEQPAQQLEAAKLGMWVFLATEVMFFGAMFFGYIAYRHADQRGFALAGEHMEIGIGTINTGILLTSSLCVALAVRYARTAERTKLVFWLWSTVVLGVTFDALKLYEYYDHYKEGFFPGLAWSYTGPEAPAVKLLFVLYYIMTGVHAVHVAIGFSLFTVLAILTARGKFLGDRGTPVQIAALYWHFVDIIWIFLYPLFYFLGGGTK